MITGEVPLSEVFDFPFSEDEFKKEINKHKKQQIRKMLEDDEKREQLKDAVKQGLKQGFEKSIAEYKRVFELATQHDGFCTIKMASIFLGVSVQRIHEFIREGRLETESFFDGKRILIKGDSLLKFIDDRKPPHRPRKKDK